MRIDAGYRSGDAVSPYYDAMLAKVIAWAPTREAAIDRLNRGLEETDVRGIVTNIPFLSALVTHPDVRANAIDTGFIERELKNLTATSGAPGDLELCAAVAAIINDGAEGGATRDAFALADLWLDAGRPAAAGFLVPPGAERRAEGHAATMAMVPRRVSVGDRELVFTSSPTDDGGFDLTLDGTKSHVVAVIEGHELYLRTRNGRFDLHWVDPFGGETEEQVGEDKIVAPLPGTVVALLAEEGAMLEKGAAILTLEVMKMEQTLRAPYAGVLKKIKCKVGDIVGEGVELAEVEPAA